MYERHIFIKEIIANIIRVGHHNAGYFVVANLLYSDFGKNKDGLVGDFVSKGKQKLAS